MSSSSSATALLVQAGLAAAISAAGLVLLQTDSVSQYVLKPDRLRQKRRNEYRYRWQRALELARLQIQYAMAGGVQQYSEEWEKLSTVRLAETDEIQHLVEQVYAGQQDEVSITRVGSDNGEVYVWLWSEPIQYQVPLLAFVERMDDALDRHVTAATYCFVSDASGGAGSMLIERLARDCFKETVAVMETPAWLVQLAVLIDQAQILTEKIEPVLSCLCRLHAHLRHYERSVSTIMYLVPTSVVPILTRWLQESFPDDRHVFCYEGCIRTMEYGLAVKSYSGSLQGDLPTVRQALQWRHPVATTTPLSKRGVETSSCIAPAAFVEAMARLTLDDAEIVEAWMAAVDAFFALKENDKVNGYIPYVCRLDYLYQPGGGSGAPQPLKEGSDRYWSLRSLLQYITGSQNREVPSETLRAAMDVLEAYDRPRVDLLPTLPISRRRAIENAVFQHKRILIENKTLSDTVQPSRHWTLKAAARKGGCSCCAPEDDDDDEDDDDEKRELKGELTNSQRRASETFVGQGNRSSKSGYVDGKAMFAFDPNRFS